MSAEPFMMMPERGVRISPEASLTICAYMKKHNIKESQSIDNLLDSRTLYLKAGRDKGVFFIRLMSNEMKATPPQEKKAQKTTKKKS